MTLNQGFQIHRNRFLYLQRRGRTTDNCLPLCQATNRPQPQTTTMDQLYRILTTWEAVLTIDFIFLVVHLWIERTRLAWKSATIVNSILCSYYSVLSLILFTYSSFIFATQTALFTSFSACTELPHSSEIRSIFFIYYLSKFHEYSDIILVLLSCRPPLAYRLHPHFRYHHLTTPFFALTFLHNQCAHHAFFMLSNLLMHAWVYRFHASSANQTTLLFWLCRIWGHVQLLLGITLSAYSLAARLFHLNSLEPCGTLFSDALPLALYLMCFALFQYQIYWPWPPIRTIPKRKSVWFCTVILFSMSIFNIFGWVPS